jgi:hypothetical protein
MICWHCLLAGAGNRVAVSVPPLRQMQGSTASDLGLPAGQPMNVFCAPTSPQSLQGQPQPAGYQPGQTNRVSRTRRKVRCRTRLARPDRRTRRRASSKPSSRHHQQHSPRRLHQNVDPGRASSVETPFSFQIGILARLHAFRFARHLGGAIVLPTMLTGISAVREHQPCGKLSGGYSPVFRQTHFRIHPRAWGWRAVQSELGDGIS